jgi:hypothetical protein
MASGHDRLPVPILLCQICNKAVAIDGAKTDSDGRPVHGECYALLINSGTEQADGKTRSWSAIAEQIIHEQDPHKVIALANELIKALGDQRLRRSNAATDGDGKIDKR